MINIAAMMTERGRGRIVNGLSGPPEDLVGTVLLLCSKAGEWISGQTISVDGGWVMRL